MKTIATRALVIAGLVALSLAAPAAAQTGVPPTPSPPIAVTTPPPPTSGPLAGTGMWIWQLTKSNRGNLSVIANRARAHHVTTLFVKSSDGRNWWSQFSPRLVATLHHAGLHLCAWQYVYPSGAAAEARLGIRAKRAGADCLVIDAEQQFEGHYVAADTYIRKLRAGVGASYPVALTSFPYIDYHPSLPYSIFLGPGGAQYNLPQMYWRAIGTSVDNVYAHSMPLNNVYGRPILPLGQLWQSPPVRQINRFRRLAQRYGSTGVSWWDWQEASSAGFNAVGSPLVGTAGLLPPTYPTLRRGARGDLVVAGQERLRAAGYPAPLNGVLGSATVRALRSLQQAAGIPVSGILDARTWAALIQRGTFRPRWVARRSAVTAQSADTATPPASESLPEVRNELAAKRHH